MVFHRTRGPGIMKQFTWCLLALASMSGGCSHVMSDGGLASADRTISYAAIGKNAEVLAGRYVLIGGIIAANRSSGDLVQLEVVQLELLSNGVPDESAPSSGRFLVVSGELLDPLIYRPGNLITVIGEIKGQQIQKLDGSDYRYPLISAKELRMFPASDPAAAVPGHPYQYPPGDRKFMGRPPGSY